MKESAGGDLVAITAGPARCEKLLRDAAAVGADTLVHVSAENINDLDSTQVQNLLAAAVQNPGLRLFSVVNKPQTPMRVQRTWGRRTHRSILRHSSV